MAWNNAYGYIVGIDQYQNLPKLCFCESDAMLFKKSIKTLIPNIKTTLVLGKGFTYKNYANFLDDIGTIDKNENDVLFFYYAGHGFSHDGADYLTYFDTVISAIKNTSVATDQLIRAATRTGVKTIVMIFDACRNSVTDTRTLFVPWFGKVTSEISNRQGIISFFSCSPGEYSQEVEELSHGIFTYALVKAFEESEYRTSVNLNKKIVYTVGGLVQKYNRSQQIPYTTVGPIEKANLDIITGKDITIAHEKRAKCILIAGPTHAGKSSIGAYLANRYGFRHYELSSLVFNQYDEFTKNSTSEKNIYDFIKKELWLKNEDKDIIARSFLEKYDGNNDVVISGPRSVEEVETFLGYNWDVIPLYIYAGTKPRMKRYKWLQKGKSDSKVFTLEEFIKKDMEELHCGLAEIATLNDFKMIINNSEISEFYKKTRKYVDPFINY